jgi:undecaprenyl-diphosphatase
MSIRNSRGNGACSSVAVQPEGHTWRAHRHLWLMAIAMLAIWLAAMLFGGAASNLDAGISSALRPEQRDWLVEVALIVTWFGDWLVLVPLALAAAGLLLWRGSIREALALLGAVAAVRLLVTLQKTWFGRGRPDVEQWAVEITNSFPSAHAANSAATFLAIAILVARSRSAIALALAGTAAVGVSRVVLGVHWPTDVVGGWAFAILVMLPLWLSRAISQARSPQCRRELVKGVVADP